MRRSQEKSIKEVIAGLRQWRLQRRELSILVLLHFSLRIAMVIAHLCVAGLLIATITHIYDHGFLEVMSSFESNRHRTKNVPAWWNLAFFGILFIFFFRMHRDISQKFRQAIRQFRHLVS